MSWVDEELAAFKFRDVRLGKRLRSIVERLSEGLGETIPIACEDWANTKAAYRFFANDRVSEAEILAGHFEATRDRVRATSGPILVLQDTTEFTYQCEKPYDVGVTHNSLVSNREYWRAQVFTVCGVLIHSRS